MAVRIVTPQERKVWRTLDYYDLIEFPSGKHVPVPLAIKRVGLKEVLKIPVAEKKRGWNFYFCEYCAMDVCEWCDDIDCDGKTLCEEAYEAGCSFYRCMKHKPIGKHETESKLALLEAFINAGMHGFLKYIEIHPDWRAISRGWIEVDGYGNVLNVVGELARWW